MRQPPQFRRLLVANRGEIAVRVLRTAQEHGIETVAVYSEADRNSLHVRLADRAVCTGPPPPAESYLRIERILEVAEQLGCDAIHPGYGFLAENSRFAAACTDVGVTFIGPSDLRSPAINQHRGEAASLLSHAYFLGMLALAQEDEYVDRRQADLQGRVRKRLGDESRK